jgi:predicted ATP-dependent protease
MRFDLPSVHMLLHPALENPSNKTAMPTRLPPDRLIARLDPAALPFASTADLPVSEGALGQARAREALAFGVAMERPGYNVFVMGEPGVGRLSLTRQYLDTRARERATPPDLLYLNHFDEPREPLALTLPAGLGKAFAADLEAFVDNLLASFPAAFEHPGCQRRKAEIERGLAGRYNQAVDRVEKRARERNVALFRDGENISFAPMLGDEPVSEEEFAAFSEADQEAFRRDAQDLEQYLAEALLDLPLWKRETAASLRRLQRETIVRAVEPLLLGLARDYGEQPGVMRYLDGMRADLPRLVGELLMEERAQDSPEEVDKREQLLRRYAPNLLVAREPGAGAPVVYEANPGYANLFGRIEYLNEQGVLVTHHRLARPGALHRANGGYLVLEAAKLPAEPQVWPSLKRALQTRELLIDPPALEQASPVVQSLKPQAFALDVKLVLIGERELYYLLQAMDDEFDELFRVLADFDEYFPRDPETVLALIRLIKRHARDAAPLSAAAAARLIEYGGRLAEHQERLSARVGDLLELTAEAELARRGDGSPRIEAHHVSKALADRETRLGRLADRMLEEMLAGTLLIDAAGAAIGRINGLTVLEAGDSRFGMPARVTATVSPGGRGVIDIEREVRLGQALHSKGVMILSGYLAHQYAPDFPLAISAHIALEQSYGYVDGDSASLAEVLALISALADAPIRQELAITGSINQYGEVQAVGGVNEKIEGFFRLCRARGLSGTQGAVIPRANISNLMLADAVVEAARRGEFAVHAVASVDEALELMTGQPAKLVNKQVCARLRKMARWAERGRTFRDN